MSERAKVTVPHLSRTSGKKKIVMVTAYDTPSGRSCDEAGVDIVLVGDSVGMVVMGRSDTLAVTIDDMVHHASCVRRGVQRALLVADMPYLSFHISRRDTVMAAGRLVREAGVEAVKLEGGRKRVEMIQALVDAEIPVMGHLGLTPQSIHRFGGYRVQGRDPEAAGRILRDAEVLCEAGVFSIVLEGMPDSLAKKITESVDVPTIGIGAGPHCDGQVLVFHDLLGWTAGPVPSFVRAYADLSGTVREAIGSFCRDVRSGDYPAEGESYGG